MKVSAVSAVPSSAVELADAGYIITAFGRAGGGEYVLVGTRVRGDTAPRPLQVWTSMNEAFGLLQGYAVVALYWDEPRDRT